MCWAGDETVVVAVAVAEVVVGQAEVVEVAVAVAETGQEVRAVEIVGTAVFVEFVERVDKEPGLSVQMPRRAEISKQRIEQHRRKAQKEGNGDIHMVFALSEK